MEQESRGKRRKSRPVRPAAEAVTEEYLPVGGRPPRKKLRWRWLFNTLAATFAVVAVAVTAFSLAMYSYYRSTILATLESKAQTAAGMFRNYTETTYLATARQFVNQFEEKNIIEVQILNSNGRVRMSSMMDISGASAHSPDVIAAINEKTVKLQLPRGLSRCDNVTVVGRIECPAVDTYAHLLVFRHYSLLISGDSSYPQGTEQSGIL